MPKVTIVAKIVAKSDTIEAVKAELKNMIEPTRKEEGCLEYRLHQDNDNPAIFVFYENWENPASVERHMNSPHFKTYVEAVGNLIADKVVHKMTEIG